MTDINGSVDPSGSLEALTDGGDDESSAHNAGVKRVDDDTRLREVASLMRQADIGAVSVSTGGELVGVVTGRGIICPAFGSRES